jgi:hypothetical protein
MADCRLPIHGLTIDDWRLAIGLPIGTAIELAIGRFGLTILDWQ